MRRRRMWLVALCAASATIALAVAGCDGTPITGTARTNANPTTQSGGSVTIATNHSAYAGSDTITVTIVNHTAAPVYAWDTRASCSILDLQVQRGQRWVAADALRCPLGRVALAVKLMPDAPYIARIGSRVMSIGTGSPLADGSYRLALTYADSPSLASQPALMTLYSAAIMVGGTAPPPVGG